MSAADAGTGFSAEQLEIRALARDFAEGEIRPHAEAWDADAGLPDAIFDKLAELGFLGMLVPEEHGGLGLDFTTWLLVVEELARGDAAVALSVAIHNGAVAGVLARHGSPEQKAAWLSRLAAGEVIGAYALSEESAGADVTALEVRATRDDGGWVFDGTKTWVTNGRRAGLALVFARTGAEGGVACFAVPRPPDGWRVVGEHTTMGLRASEFVDVDLTGVRVPADALVGDPGAGAAYADETLVPQRASIAAQALGIGAAALEYATGYALERRQFGRSLSDFDATQAKLAEMAARLSGARAAVHETGRRIEALRRGGDDAGRGADALAARAAGAKLLAATTAMYAADEAVQIYGGYGYMRDYPVERLMRDAKGTEIYEGTNETMRVVIAREVLSEAQGEG
jgi:hypothetical protein